MADVQDELLPQPAEVGMGAAGWNGWDDWPEDPKLKMTINRFKKMISNKIHFF